jgi:arginine repressor
MLKENKKMKTKSSGLFYFHKDVEAIAQPKVLTTGFASVLRFLKIFDSVRVKKGRHTMIYSLYSGISQKWKRDGLYINEYKYLSHIEKIKTNSDTIELLYKQD